MVKAIMPLKKSKAVDSLASRLAAYTSLAAAICAFQNEAKAEIIYTDLNPDYHVVPSYYFNNGFELDLNNDGIVDFVISGEADSSFNYYSSSGTFFWSYERVQARGVSKNQILVDDDFFALALDFNNQINANGQWLSASLGTDMIDKENSGVYGEHVRGNWVQVTHKYLGLRIMKGGNYYYGWARLTIDGYDKCFVEEYAYQSIPDKEIYAGEGAQLAVTVSYFGNSLDLKYISTSEENIQIELIDLSGRIFFTMPGYALDGYNEYSLTTNDLPVAFIASVRGRNSRASQLVAKRN